jgi:hypothetical protein
MRIAMVNPPYRYSADTRQWITVPPQGYGAIQWVCAHLLTGMRELGHSMTLLGAPGSAWPADVEVLDLPAEEFDAWAARAEVDVVHDHSNGLIDPAAVSGRAAFLSTHHLTGPPRRTVNCTYVSAAQRASGVGPVVPLPVDPARHEFRSNKDDYLLFLGRASPHKGCVRGGGLRGGGGDAARGRRSSVGAGVRRADRG